MKKIYLLKTIVLLCALVAGSVSGWAAEVTFTAGADTGENSVTKGVVTVSMSTMSRTDNYRCYAGTGMTISSTNAITKIEVTCTGSGTSENGPGKFSGTGYTYSGTKGTWSGNATSITLSASAQVRITSIVVTYIASTAYTVTLADGGSLEEETAGSGVTLPSRDAISDYTFAGWSETNVPNETTTAPTTIIPAGKYYPTDNITLYPVYIRSESGAPTSKTVSVDIRTYAEEKKWTNSGMYNNIPLDENINANASGSGSYSGKYYNKNGYSWRIYKSENGKLTLTASNGAQLSSATISFSNSTLSYDGNDINSGQPVTISGTTAEFAAGGTTYITAISVDYTIASTGTTYYWSTPVASAVERPVITVAESFNFSTKATITCATEGATIYYRYSENDEWAEYTSSLTINATTTIYSKAVKGNDESSVASKTATKELVTPTVTVSGNLNTDIEGGTNVSAGTLSAAVTYNDNQIQDANVTWSSSNTGVATIDENTGAVTLIATGTTTITATYTGNEDYEDATGTYELTVINSQAMEQTWDLSTNSYSNASTEQVTWTSTFVTMVADKASSSTNANNYLPTTYSSSRFYKNSTLTITPAPNYHISSITFTATTENFATALANSTWTNATTSASGTTVTVTPTDGTKALVATIGANCGFTSVKVTYAKSTTATITLNSACTDGSMVYGTYSNSSAFVVSDDIVVSEVGVTNGKLVVEEYKTGAVVPANTGVLVSALEGGDYTVVLSSEMGTSVLGEGNLLRATGESITAEEMADKDANCLYYRLTMQNGETIGFWWGAENGAAFAVGANKAYLAVPKTENARMSFWMGNEGSGIADMVLPAKKSNGVVYDLQGRRVANAAKGLYIVEGKKVLVK